MLPLWNCRESARIVLENAVYAVLQEVISLLTWSMLAACTVGPGTVVTCARAGAEHDLELLWALVFATILAYTLQVNMKRLIPRNWTS